MDKGSYHLVSYIAPAAPATRRLACGDEPFLRPEIGFTPKWYHRALDIDFGERWHTNPEYRKETILLMRSELKRRFSETGIGHIDEPDSPLDLLTGTYGACTIAAMYGIPIHYNREAWPVCQPRYLSENELEKLVPIKPEENKFFQKLVEQLFWIKKSEGRLEGFINWQGVLNNAHRLRGQQLFMDFYENPDRTRRLLKCICTTMIEAAKKLHSIQKKSGVRVNFFTVSNCLVNMVSAEIYRDFLLPFDVRIAKTFECIGIHNCAWNANPYLRAYATIPHVGYIDMGMDSDLELARQLFLHTRRAIMYTPMDVANKSLQQIRQDLECIANHYAPCDIVAADIEHGTSDERICDFVRICKEISSHS